jgi:hypothetical protein
MMRDGLCRDVVMRGYGVVGLLYKYERCGLLWAAVVRGGVRWDVTRFESCSRVVWTIFLFTHAT